MSDKPTIIRVNLTDEQKLAAATLICETYALGSYTIDNACVSQGIPVRTFHDWTKSHAEIADLYKRARLVAASARKAQLKEMALNALGKLITGYTAEETATEYELYVDPDTGVRMKRIAKLKTYKKHFQPSPGAVIYALKVSDPANFNLPGTGMGAPGHGQEDGGDAPVKKQVYVIGGREIEF